MCRKKLILTHQKMLVINSLIYILLRIYMFFFIFCSFLFLFIKLLKSIFSEQNIIDNPNSKAIDNPKYHSTPLSYLNARLG